MRRGVVLALLATVLWSSTGIFIDRIISAYHMTPVAISCWRAILVALALALWGAIRSPAAFQISRREIPYYALYGLIGIAIFNVFWSTSVQVNKAAVATALTFSAPAFVALGERLLFGVPLAVAPRIAIGVNYVGCALVAGLTSPSILVHSPKGLLLGLASGLAFSAYSLFGKGATRLGRRSALTILFYAFAFAAVCLLAWGLGTEGRSLLAPALDLQGWCLLLGLAFGPTLGGYACFTASLRHLSATRAGLLTTLEPPITAILAFVLLGRIMNGVQWLGIALVVAGVLVVQIGALTVPGRRSTPR